MERGIIKESDNPFSLVSSNNPQILNMNSGSEKQINFQLKATGQIGTYDLVIFASEKESKSIEIEIKPEPAKTENIEREQTKKHYEEISNTNINNAIVKTNPTQYEEFNQGPTKITADVISDSKRQPIIKIILIFSSIIFLALLILVVYLRKKDKMYIQA